MKKWKWFSPATDPLIVGLDEALVALLDAGRENAGVAFHLTSGVRSKEHNKAVGGVAGSAHVTGQAADLAVYDSVHLGKMIKGLQQAGARRLVIGIVIENGKVAYHNLHVDIDDDKPLDIVSVKVYS